VILTAAQLLEAESGATGREVFGAGPTGQSNDTIATALRGVP
jgi:hypothetical protein